MSSAGGVIRQWRRQPCLYDSRDKRNPLTAAPDKGQEPVNIMTRNYRPAAMRASDADRDAVVSDLSEHFQAGRLTAAELDERTGRALTARTWGELTKLAADLPALRPAAPPSTPAAGRPQPPSGHTAPAPTAVLAGLAIAAVVLVHVVYGGWGLIWLVLPALLIARRALCH
jgi:Domain of unknown function (DUF1707)